MTLSKIFAIGALLGTAWSVALPSDTDLPSAVDSSILDQSFHDYLSSNPEDYTIHSVLGDSAANLNITMTDILNPEFRATNGLDSATTSPVPRGVFSKRWNDQCLDRSNFGHVLAAYACRDIINSRGGLITVYGQYQLNLLCNIDVAHAGYINVYGQPLLGSSTSAAGDVATGVNWIIQHCLGNICNCGVAGAAAAYGNGNFIVWAKNN